MQTNELAQTCALEQCSLEDRKGSIIDAEVTTISSSCLFEFFTFFKQFKKLHNNNPEVDRVVSPNLKLEHIYIKSSTSCFKWTKVFPSFETIIWLTDNNLIVVIINLLMTLVHFVTVGRLCGSDLDAIVRKNGQN